MRKRLLSARPVMFWLMLGGFVWVIGDLFQQFATKYVGISRGIPLSNTNQLWGLLWGILVFHELQGGSHAVYLQVAGGSLLMALGEVGIALSSATEREHSSWQDAAERRPTLRHRRRIRPCRHGRPSRRTLLDWLLIAGTTGLFVVLAAMANFPHVEISVYWALALAAAMLALLVTCGIFLWRTTEFR